MRVLIPRAMLALFGPDIEEYLNFPPSSYEGEEAAEQLLTGGAPGVKSWVEGPVIIPSLIITITSTSTSHHSAERVFSTAH